MYCGDHARPSAVPAERDRNRSRRRICVDDGHVRSPAPVHSDLQRSAGEDLHAPPLERPQLIECTGRSGHHGRRHVGCSRDHGRSQAGQRRTECQNERSARHVPERLHCFLQRASTASPWQPANRLPPERIVRPSVTDPRRLWLPPHARINAREASKAPDEKAFLIQASWNPTVCAQPWQGISISKAVIVKRFRLQTKDERTDRGRKPFQACRRNRGSFGVGKEPRPAGEAARRRMTPSRAIRLQPV